MPGATVAAGSNGEDDEVVHDFSPLLLVYASGRLERPLIVPLVPPDLDAATGVESKDVPLSPSTFVRLYLPPGASAGGGDNDKKKAKLPVVVYFHGGGFEIGSAASRVYHRFLSDLAAASPVGIIPAVAVSVDYRLAPEHVLPAAYDDSLAALKWVLSGADRWLAAHGDLARMFLAGDSTGGNICHNLAMHRTSVGAVLIHPWFWGREPVGWAKEHRRRSPRKRKHLWEFVCPGAADGMDDPRMNPSAPGAPGLESLACERVMVCVAEGDHLRWRGKAYAAVVRARKKKRADEPVVAAKSWAEGGGGGPQTAVELFEGGLGHVFYLLDPEMEEAKRLLGRIAAFVSAK
uniref:Alpha/beta hydrolase fold-3 domain-containing protein n=1 Tax=Setaria viridis TaxID=4556 RepID=A0A4U6TPN8_SETVI|nr:LOW QUALITY PROTEIN: hypothetical protein SEVIR_7G125400v2 [Setaria viridis]